MHFNYCTEIIAIGRTSYNVETTINVVIITIMMMIYFKKPQMRISIYIINDGYKKYFLSFISIVKVVCTQLKIAKGKLHISHCLRKRKRVMWDRNKAYANHKVKHTKWSTQSEAIFKRLLAFNTLPRSDAFSIIVFRAKESNGTFV